MEPRTNDHFINVRHLFHDHVLSIEVQNHLMNESKANIKKKF